MGSFGGRVWEVETGMFHLLNMERAENLTDLRSI